MLFFIFPVFILLISCSSPDSGAVFETRNTELYIWDQERILASYNELTSDLYELFPGMMILSGNLPEDAAAVLERKFQDIDKDSLCILIVISGRTAFQLSSEWNMWFPQLWRSLDCSGRVLIADAPWGDEFINPVKTKKVESVWVIDGGPGYLRKKLENALSAASCRFDEANMVSRGIDGKTKTPLYSWYFLDLLRNELRDGHDPDIVQLLRTAGELTFSAHERGVVSDIEKVLFFNRSQVARREFTHYPNPVLWNGLSDRVLLRGVH